MNHAKLAAMALDDSAADSQAERSRSGVTWKPITGRRDPHRPRVHGKLIGSTRLGSLFLTLPTRGLTGQQIMPSDG